MLLENFEKFVFEKYRDNDEFNEFLKENLEFDLELERENEFLISQKPIEEMTDENVLDYLEEINLYEPLTNEEYEELIDNIEDQESKDKIIVNSFTDIAKLALYFLRDGVEYLELVQEGLMGAIEALNRYSYDNGDLKKYMKIWSARQMSFYIEERFEQMRQEFLYYFTKTHMDDVEITNEEIDKKVKALENLTIDDIAFSLSKNEIKAIEYYFGLGLEKRYSVFEIEKEMKLEKNQGEALFSVALAKISSRDGRMFSL